MLKEPAIRFPLIVLAFLGFGGVRPFSAQINSTTPKAGDTLRGTVLNSATHSPLARALVYSPDNRFAALTGDDGRFEFKVPVNEANPTNNERGMLRQYNLEITTGIPRSRLPFSLAARKPEFLSPENQPFTPIGPDQEDVTINLTPEAIVAGRVTLLSDSFYKIQVELDRRLVQNGMAHWNPVSTVIVRSDGGFRFANLPAGTYKIFTHELLDLDPLTFDPRGQLYGFPPVYYPAANDFASGMAIQMAAGAILDATLSPTRRKYYPVAIDVANATPGQGLRVEVSPSGQGGPGFALRYDGGRHQILGSLPDGPYNLSAWAFGPTGESGDLTFTVAGAPARGMAVTLVPNISINVNLTDESTATQNIAPDAGPGPTAIIFSGNGQPRGRYVNVSLLPADEFGQRPGASLRRPTGPDDDSLVLENVQPGRYWVEVNTFRGYAAAIKCGETDLLRHPLVVLGSGTPPIELTIRDDGAEIYGTIQNAPRFAGSNNGADMPHVYFIPLPDGTGQFRDTWVSPDGNFFAQQIPPGEYGVVAFDRPYAELEFRNAQVMEKFRDAMREVQLVSGQKEHLTLRMISGSGQ